MSRSCRSLRRRHVLAALLVACVAAGCDGGASGSAQAATRAVRGDTARPIAAESAGVEAVVESIVVDAPLAFPAQLHVERDVAVAARTTGVLVSVRADLGSMVGGGAVLATVESEDQRLAVARAQAAHDGARRLVDRARRLTGSGGVTPADSEAAELGLREAELGLQEAGRALALTSVTAPFAGVVSARYVGPHRLVRAGDTLFRLTETGPLLARVHVPEAQAASLAAGAPATVVALDGSSTAARVTRLSPAVDAASGSREVVLAVARGSALRPGSAVTVRLGTARRQVTAVPAHVVGDDGVVLVLDGGRAVLRALTLGASLDGGRVEVVSGLAVGERVRRPGGPAVRP